MKAKVPDMKSAMEKAKTLKDGARKVRPGKRSGKASKASSSKKGKFVLFLGDDGAILVFIQDGKVVRRLYAPSVEEEHIASLMELLQGHPHCPIYVLVDMIDQSYVRHTLPPVSPLGVGKLVQRRLDRDFVPEDIKGSLSLGREKTGRKEWNFLLIALANSTALQQWMDIVLELPNRFMGIFLVPVEAQSLVGELADKLKADKSTEPAAKWQILVTHDKVSGVRQVVLKDGRLIFTRLTQSGHESSPDVMAGNVEQEILNTVEYLRRLSYSEQTGLEIFIVISQDIKEKIDSHKLKATHTHIMTPYEVSQLLNLGQAALSSDRFGDVVVATAFGMKRRHLLRLLPAYGKKLDRIYKARTAGRMAAALVVGALAWQIASQLIHIQSTYSTVSTLKKEFDASQLKIADVQKTIDALGENQNTILNAATVYRISQAENYKPLDFVKSLAPVLQPGVLVRSFYWQAQATPGTDPKQPAPAQAATAIADDSVHPFVVNLEVEITDHGGRRQQLIANSDALIARLKANFAQFSIQHEKMLATTKEEEKFVVNFDDLKVENKEMKEGENILKLTMTGPLPPELLQGEQVPANPQP